MQGKHQFFDDLFRQHYKMLRAYSMQYVKDIKVAEDIVQDVFFELWRNPNINLHHNLKAYLFKATYSRSITHLSSKRNKGSVNIDTIKDELDRYWELIMQHEDTLLKQEMLTEIQQCVDALPPQCKEIFTLRNTYELKNKEIAEQRGVSVKAIEKQISKSLVLIRQHLKNRGYL